MRNVQTLTLDINKKTFQSITANAGEIASRFVRINIVDNSIPVDITGVTVYLYAKKPDNKTVFNSVTIEDAKNGIVLAELTSQILVIEGLVKLTLLLVKDGSKLASKQFFVNVDESIIDDEVVESTNEFTALLEALGRVNNIDNRFENVSSQLEHKASNTSNLIEKLETDLQKNSNNIAIRKSGTQYHVFTPLGDNYCRYILDRDVFTDAQSVGIKGELTRVIGCYPNNDVFALIPHDLAVLSGTWSDAEEVPDEISIIKNQGNIGYRWSNTVGAKATFSGIKGNKLNVAVCTSPNAGKFKVWINGVDCGIYQKQKALPKSIEILEIPQPLTLADNTVVIEIIEGTVSLVGINCFNLKNFDKSLWDSNYRVKWGNKDNSQSFYNGNGANDYALSICGIDGTGGLWCGSYHGGETLVEIKPYFDNTRILLNSGDSIVCEQFELYQETNITHTRYTGNIINSKSTIRFDKLGYNINYKFKFLQDTLVNRAEVMMATNNTGYFDSYILTNGFNFTGDLDYTNENQDVYGVIHFGSVLNGTPYVAIQKFNNFYKSINNWLNNSKMFRIQRVKGLYQKTYGTRIMEQTLVKQNDIWEVSCSHRFAKTLQFRYMY